MTCLTSGDICCSLVYNTFLALTASLCFLKSEQPSEWVCCFELCRNINPVSPLIGGMALGGMVLFEKIGWVHTTKLINFVNSVLTNIMFHMHGQCILYLLYFHLIDFYRLYGQYISIYLYIFWCQVWFDNLKHFCICRLTYFILV